MRYGIGAAIGLLTATSALAQPASDSLARIGHIVVIFEENRSFDNFFGSFPGANGFSTAGTLAPQIGPDGKPYKFLPAAVDTNLKPAADDPRFPAQLPNQPFEINPYVSLEEDTGDLIHAFYQEQMQINGGAMNRFAEVSNAKGLVMGHFDISGHCCPVKK
jgi:phospholipase C